MLYLAHCCIRCVNTTPLDWAPCSCSIGVVSTGANRSLLARCLVPSLSVRQPRAQDGERDMATQVQPPLIDERHLRMTYEEFLAWANEDTRAEWVDGEVILFMPQSRRHIRLISFLLRLIGGF